MINKQAQLKKLTIIVSVLLIMGLVFVLADVNFTPVYPTNNITTNESFVNITTNFSTDFLEQINYTIRDTTYIIQDNSTLIRLNFNNNSLIPCGTGVENDTCVADLSIYNNSGQVYGGSNITFITGKSGKALKQYGNLSYVGFSADSELSFINTSSFTISAWINISSDLTNPVVDYSWGIVQKEGTAKGYRFEIRNDRKLYLKNPNGWGGTASSGTITNNTYNHVVMVYNNQTVTFYINGVPAGGGTRTDWRSDTSSTLNIGKGSAYFNGSIDEVMIVNRSLTADEVSKLYNTQIYKYNSTNFGISINETGLNYSSSLLNYSNPTRVNNYKFCVSNYTIICESEKSITQTILKKSLNINFSTSVGTIRDDMYGVTTGSSSQVSSYLMNNSGMIDANADGTLDTNVNSTWHRQAFLEGGYKVSAEFVHLSSYVDAIYNRDFEEVNNNSIIKAELNQSYYIVNGWRIASYRNQEGYIQATTDAKSGNYAIAINTTTAGGTGSNLYLRPLDAEHLKFREGTEYNVTYWIKGVGTGAELYVIYNGVIVNSTTFNPTSDWKSYSLTFTPSSLQTSSLWRLDVIVNNGVNLTIDNFSITQNGTEMNDYWLNIEDTSFLDDKHELYLWGRNNGIKFVDTINFQLYDIANLSAYCTANVLDTDISDCYPSNPDLMGKIIRDYINLTTDNGEYLDVVEYIIGNDVGMAYHLDQLDANDPTKTIYFNAVFNATASNIRNAYPNAKVGGLSLEGCIARANLQSYYMGNFSNISNINYGSSYSCHQYLTPSNGSSIYTLMETGMTNIINNCTASGYDCSNIYFNEGEIGHGTVGDFIKNMTTREGEYEMHFNQFFTSILNNHPSNFSFFKWWWADRYNYSQTGYYSEYPRYWHAVSEPAHGLDYRPPYWSNYYLSRVCQTGGKSYRINLDECIYATACNKNNQYGLLLENVCDKSYNISNLNLSLTNGTVTYPYTEIINLKTNEVYTVNSGVIDFGSDAVMDSYQNGGTNNIFYLTSGVSPTITNIQPANLTINTTSPINFSANLTDDVGLTNATLNIMNTSDNSLITNFVEYVSGEVSVIFSALIDLADGIYKWWISLWDDEGKETISGNYTLTVDTISPIISFESPTPSSSSIVISPNQTIVANVSDANNVSSWIDFDRSLVGYWAMDYYNSTVVFDNSSYNNNASFNGNLTSSNISSGIRGDGILFSGNKGYLNIPNSQPLKFVNTSEMTISAWIYVSSNWTGTPSDGGMSIVIKQGSSKGYRFNVRYDRYLMLKNLNGYSGTSSTTRIANNTFVHVLLTYNNMNTTFYINGAYAGTGVRTDWRTDDTTAIQIGNLGDNYFNGSIDEVMIFNRSLSRTEINALYNSQSNKFNASFNNLLDGQHDYTVYAIDQAGNFNLSSQNFEVDTTPPIITITNPTTADENANPVNLIASTNEVSTCAYSLDSQANISMGTNTGFLVPITLSNGVHTIKVFCNDSLINQNTTGASISFNVYLGGGVTGGGGDTTTPIVNVTNTTIINNTTVIGNESEKFDGKIDLGDIKIGEFTIGTWALIGIIVGILFLILLAFIIDAIRKK